MTTTTPNPSSLLVLVTDPLFTVGEQQALAGFLCGYSGLTRDAYTLDLRQYTARCTGLTGASTGYAALIASSAPIRSPPTISA